MQLRPYQQRVLDDLWEWFHRHPDGNPIVNAAVGAGKSILIASLAQRAMKEFPGTRILVVVHQKELLEQNLQKLQAVWPEAPVGIHSAAVGRKDMGHDILYATIGSIYKKAHLLGRVDLILADECHLINPKESGMWRRLIGDIKQYCPQVRVIGWTGTPFRGDGVWLTAGDLFHGVAAKVTIKELVAAGFLTPLVLADTKLHMSAEGVSVVNGDYKINELDAKVNRKDLIDRAVDEAIRLASDRKRWLVYCVTIKHAANTLEALRARGIDADMVSAETPKAFREEVIGRFRRGELRALVNVAVLTTGFDVPEVDCIILMRNTKSPVLYVQIAGRGMRISPGKDNCLWLDFTDTTMNQGPVDAIKGRNPTRKRETMAPVKLCEECGTINHIKALVCIDCGAPFDVRESDPHHAYTNDAAIMSRNMRFDVTNVTYAKHNKEGRPPSLRVEYWSGLRIIAKEWVALESESSYGRNRAAQWWLDRSQTNPPLSVDEALIYVKDLRRPSSILIDKSGKYAEVIGYEWPRTVSFEDGADAVGSGSNEKSVSQLSFM